MRVCNTVFLGRLNAEHPVFKIQQNIHCIRGTIMPNQINAPVKLKIKINGMVFQ